MTTWADQSLTFTYYFPTYGAVFTGSPISFLGDGSEHLSTLSNLKPATFSVSSVSPWEVQIAYFYPEADYPNGAALTGTQPFNGFTISGPVDITPITAVVIDANNTVTELTEAALSFSGNSVTVNLAGIHMPVGSVALIDVFMPEPGTMVTFVSGLLLMFAMTRLRQWWMR